MRRVCVTGARDYDNRAHVDSVLSALHDKEPISLIIHGRAFGADMLATHWARAHDIPLLGFQAEWQLHGRSAGPIRNAIMLREGRPDLVVAFPSEGPGTLDCVTQARRLGIPVFLTGAYA